MLSSFLQNTGAMAGVFTVVGVVGLAIISYIVYKIMRRRARSRDEEDDGFFEKYNDPEPPLNNNNSNTTMEPLDSAYNVATVPAAHDAYPDRATHYGPSDGGAAAYDYPQQYAAEYPPGTAYAAAQNGAQYEYQYAGQAGGYAGQEGGYAGQEGGYAVAAAYASNTQAAYAPNGQAAYAPNGQAGYAPNNQAGYAPNNHAGYAPDGQPGYANNVTRGPSPEDAYMTDPYYAAPGAGQRR